MKIIAGEKFSKCSLVITSRPHSIADVKRYFPTVLRTRGFTQETAKEFALKILDAADEVKTAMNLTATPLIRQDSPYTCPLLLSFKCILVRDEEYGFTKKAMFLGDIYAKMIRCLYKAFTLRKGISYQNINFFDMLLKIGKLAFETLIWGNYDSDRREIIQDIGGDAFNYGLIIGHEIDRVAPAGTGDIHVNFLDEGIQYFLGALHFMQMLTNGESARELLHSSCGNTVIRDPLFLHFALWMLKKSEGHFSFRNTDQAYGFLKNLVTYELMQSGAKIWDLPSLCSAFGFPYDAVAQDELISVFFEEIITKLPKPFDYGQQKRPRPTLYLRPTDRI